MHVHPLLMLRMGGAIPPLIWSSQHVQRQLSTLHYNVWHLYTMQRGGGGDLHSNKSKSCVTKNSLCTMWNSSSYCMSHFHLKIFTSPGCIWETNTIAWIAPNISLQMLVIRTCIHLMHTICTTPVFLTFDNWSVFMHHITKKCWTWASVTHQPVNILPFTA
jgi:hypothetical protein